MGPNLLKLDKLTNKILLINNIENINKRSDRYEIVYKCPLFCQVELKLLNPRKTDRVLIARFSLVSDR
ncbi:unnamed protein product [Rhizophagus irregularis]|nr:unnamed protein product [Rhizophagus irregularis]CAB5369946.1 unnamed protein product [Rhizophagus irregularis]